jgi:dienelactone hydrolase
MTMLARLIGSIALVFVFATSSTAQTRGATPAPVRPTIEQFAADASFRSPSLSPSGRYVAGVKQEGTIDELVVIDLETRQAQVIQRANETAGVQLGWVDWKTDDLLIIGTLNRVLITDQARITGSNIDRSGKGEEVWIPRVLASPRTGGATVAMFSGQARRLALRIAPTSFVSRLPRDPDHVLLSAYGLEGLTLWRANVKTGVVAKVEDAGWDTTSWVTDVNGTAVMRSEGLPRNSGYRFFRRGPGQRQWVKFLEVKKADVGNDNEFGVFTAAPEPGKVFVSARLPGNDRAAMFAFDTATGEYGAPLLSHPIADITTAMIDDTSHTLLAACAVVHRMECAASDPVISRHLRSIDQFFGRVAVVSVLQMSADQKTWLLAVEEPATPVAYFFYRRDQARIEPIAATRASLAGAQLATTKVVSYTARDGTALWGFLTGGAEAGARPKPLVVMPHGGPESRDIPGFDEWAQFLASRGYAVFQPNFRGGGGFGRAFAEAGYRQWGKRMQDDVTDGLKHLVDTAAADPARVCIFGWSYGGYAALAGGALTPDLYKCVISGAGPSDLLRMLEFEREEEGRGSGTYAYWKRAIGDPGADREAIIAASPRRLAQNFKAPVLLLHGVEDDVVPVEQSRMMRSALESAAKQVRLVEFEEEGHGLVKVASTVTLYTELETFLAQHLPAN